MQIKYIFISYMNIINYILESRCLHNKLCKFTLAIVAFFSCVGGIELGLKDERGDLFFELLCMIVSKRPRVSFVDNVKNMLSHDQRRFLHHTG